MEQTVPNQVDALERGAHAMPPLIRFLLTHVANGIVLGLSLGEVMLFADVAQIGRLIAASDQPITLTALFFLTAAVLFGTLNMAVALVTLPTEGP
ncbi:MAG: hypothetical protein EOP02_08680 [Proteobacteria bacterium]|nr:MAG: hypothetical protein EOP02_08680 [Pseudomonadota bacterium]